MAAYDGGAAFNLGQDIRDLYARAGTGDFGTGGAPAGVSELLGSWNPNNGGSYAGYTPGMYADRFAEMDKRYGLTGEGETARRRAAGLDDQGYLLPGFSAVKQTPLPYAGMTQDAARKAAFLRSFPTGSEDQYKAFLASTNQGGGYNGFETNALGSPNWGTMSFADPTRYSNPVTARPASLGAAAPFIYGAMTLPSAPVAMGQPAKTKSTEQAPMGAGSYMDYLPPEVKTAMLKDPNYASRLAPVHGIQPDDISLNMGDQYSGPSPWLLARMNDPTVKGKMIYQEGEFSNTDRWMPGAEQAALKNATYDPRYGLLYNGSDASPYWIPRKYSWFSNFMEKAIPLVAGGLMLGGATGLIGAGGTGAGAGSSSTLFTGGAGVGEGTLAATAPTAAGATTAGSLGSGLTLPGAAPTSLAPGTLGSGLTMPGAATTSIAPGALGSGITAPSVLGPTFAAETLVPGAAAATLPGYTPSYDIYDGMNFGGQGLNPTSTTGLTAPTSPSLGSMGGGTGLTVGTEAGTLGAGGLTPAGVSAAPTSLLNDSSNYLSNPYTANPDPYTPPSSIPNVLNSLPPGLKDLGASMFDKNMAPLLTNLIQTLITPGGNSGGESGGLVPGGNTPSGSATPDPSTGLDDPNAYLPYGIGWRGMKGDKARKRDKRGAGSTAADPNYDESQAGVMKIGPTKVRAVRQHKKPERQYG